jgi:LPXTG-motif cell wall-anchored protein
MMRFTTRRGAVAAGGLALVALVAAAAPAHAAGGTIVVDQVVAAAEPLAVSGTCTAGSATAVVTVRQEGGLVASESVDVGPDLSYRVSLDISRIGSGEAVADVTCLAYGAASPLGTDAVAFYAVAGDETPYEVPVEVAPGRVALGGTLTVSAQCRPGTLDATVLVGNTAAEEAFASAPADPAPDGSLTVRVAIAKDADIPGGPAPTAGGGTAVVFCGDIDAREGSGPVGIGLARFTITPAGLVQGSAPSGSTDSPGSAQELANTGSDTAPMLALAASLVLAGAGAHLVRRRLTTA